MSAERIGILGGSFDPIHSGHIEIAQAAMAAMRLDRVLFIPANQAPLKCANHAASASDRMRMARLAIADFETFESCELEMRKSGLSYSVDTARDLSIAYPGTKLFWIIGADQVSKLDQWREIDALCAHVEFIALSRPGFELAQSPLSRKIHVVDSPQIDISSTQIREKLRKGESVKYFLPPAVLEYINSQNLYQQAIDQCHQRE